jgi:predicted PurR-regulated permease PerM
VENDLDCRSLHSGQRFALASMAAFFVVLGIWTLRAFLPALAWAAIFAVALWPAYRRAEGTILRPGHRVLLPLLFTVGAGLVVVIPLALMGAELAHDSSWIAQCLQTAQARGIPLPPQIALVPLAGPRLADLWIEHLAHPHPAAGMFGHLDHQVLISEGRSFGAYLLRRLTQFGFMLLTLFMLLRHGNSLTCQLSIGARRAFGGTGERIGLQIVASIRGTVTGMVLVGLAEGAVLSAAYVVARVPHPLLLGAASAVLAILPYGATASAAVAALFLAGSGKVAGAVTLFVFGASMAFISDHSIRPILVGGNTRLPFLWVLLGILGGIEVWGLLGLFIGPAIMAALIMLWRDWIGESLP